MNDKELAHAADERVPCSTEAAKEIDGQPADLSVNLMVLYGSERAGFWLEPHRVVLSPEERERLIARLLRQRASCVQMVNAGLSRHLPAGPLAGAEIALARYLGIEEEPRHRAAALYAAGLVSGQVAPVADRLDCTSLAAALGSPVELEILLHLDDGWDPDGGPRPARHDPTRYVLNAQDWQQGVGFLHALAHGAVMDPATDVSNGRETGLTNHIRMPTHLLRDTGLTLTDFAHSFNGDLITAAAALVRAARARGRDVLAPTNTPH